MTQQLIARTAQGALVALRGDNNGNLLSGELSGTGTTTSVVSAAVATAILAANTARKAVSLANDSTAIVYVLLGAGTVSATNYTFALPAKGTVPSDRTISDFTGVITAIWASANGFMRVTELT